jgi:hypothetical protein
MRIHHVLLFVFICGAAFAESITPLPRIAVRDRAFHESATGRVFVPKGFNHTVLEKGSSGWHATFNTDIYDPKAMENLLSRMEAIGANTLRVWIWGTQGPHGFTGGRKGVGLNKAYMENVVDFLARATRHGIYVIPILDETPHNVTYNQVSDQTPKMPQGDLVTGRNRQHFCPGPIAAKAAAIQDFLRYIKAADPGLLQTVLGWAFSNEVFVNTTLGPFQREEGVMVLADGIAYDMALPAERQACYDAAIRDWANALTKAVKSIDPQALTTAGQWTADAHARAPKSGLPHDGKDTRIPPRPSVFAAADCLLDFLDIHIYPWDGTSTVRPQAHEADQVAKSNKPVIVGEIGVFKRNTMPEARVMLDEMLTQAYALGYAGHLLWSWDLSMVPHQTWSAIEEGFGEFAMTLGPKK